MLLGQEFEVEAGEEVVVEVDLGVVGVGGKVVVVVGEVAVEVG